jgi:hypothetical protein
MNAIALTIGNITVRHDKDGRFNLNDLHKASGGANKHRPSIWLSNQQTIALLDELSSNSCLAPVESLKGGKTPGTYVVKELVYAYAMWISAKFHITVIRAYDALVTGAIPTTKSSPERKTKKALPGCLTLEQQDVIKAMVKSRGERVPNEKSASVIIKTWSAIKTKFGCTYKEIPQEDYLNVVSLIERLPIEGELLEKETSPAIPETTDLDYNHAREHLQNIKAMARLSVDDAMANELNEEMEKLEQCIVRAWTEMDEALHRMSHATLFLRRWRGRK